MGKSQRTKGAGFERELCALLSERIGAIVKRNIGQARDGGDDITIPRRHGGNFRIEAKRRARIGNVYEWLDQVNAASDIGDIPVVIARADGKKAVVVIELEHFIPLLMGEL